MNSIFTIVHLSEIHTHTPIERRELNITKSANIRYMFLDAARLMCSCCFFFVINFRRSQVFAISTNFPAFLNFSFKVQRIHSPYDF